MPTSFRETGRPTPGTVVSQNMGSGFPTPKVLIAAPGAGKQIILMSISTTVNCSLGTGSDGASTFYYARDGNVSFPIGIAIGDNAQVSSNGTSGYISLTYCIVSL